MVGKVNPRRLGTRVSVVATGGGRRTGQSDHEAGTGLALLDGDRSAVRGSDLRHDGQPETGTAPVAAPRRVQAHEPVEDPAAIIGRDPGTVVADRDDRFAAFAGEVELPNSSTTSSPITSPRS